MNQHSKINRREFLRKSVVHTGMVALTGGVLGATALRARAEETPSTPAPQPLAPMPKVKHRRLGRTNIEVSEICASGDSLRDFVAFSLVVDAGVNYFHKADGAFSNPRNREVLLKNRDRFYLDVVTDRLDEQGAYDQFESKRQQIGSEYVDFFKIQSTWKTVEDFQTKRGVLAAYDRLKKEKKVRWLALSKHGENTPEVLIAAMESGMFDAIQPAVPAPDAFQRVLKVARDKDVGVICMKTGAAKNGKLPEFAKFGDPGQPFRTYYRYLLSLEGVTAIVSNFKNFDQMRENLGASGAPMTKSEVEALTLALAQAPIDYRDCITCGQCHGDCPDGLAVADIMRYRMYAEDYSDWTTARAYYEQLPAAWKAALANGQGVSDTACPYGLPLKAELKQARHWLA
jgi:predicted aldo/keto reductase-like oxidoreductase